MTTYTNWMVGEKINICASIDEFCGTEFQVIFVNDINVTKLSDTCTVIYGTERGCGLHLNNVTLTFKLVKCSDSTEGHTCNPEIVYKTIGSATTNSNGVCGILYEVTKQDRLDYESQITDDAYEVMACITNSDGQTTRSSAISEVTSSISITKNLCYGLPQCSDTCIGNDLYSQICDPNTGNCVQGSLKEINSLLCTATNYIEYDYSIFPIEFLNLVSNNIVDISNLLGNYLPLPSNIQYVASRFENSKFRIYVKYTEPLPITMTLRYNIYPLYELTLSALAGIISGFIILWIETIILTKLGAVFINPYTIGGAVLIAVAGAILISFTIYDFIKGTSTQGTTPGKTPDKQIDDTKTEFDKAIAKCKNDNPCISTTTCTVDETKLYNTCIETAKLIQSITNNNIAGTDYTEIQNKVNAMLSKYSELQTNLTNGTISINDALTDIENRLKEAEAEAAALKAQVTCPSGQIYNKETQKCEKVCNFPFIGQCLDTPLTIGGILLGGYVVYKIVSSKK